MTPTKPKNDGHDTIDARQLSEAEWKAALRDLQAQGVRNYVLERDRREFAEMGQRFAQHIVALRLPMGR